jgi:UDP-N-acetylglucosamine 2-epimerase
VTEPRPIVVVAGTRPEVIKLAPVVIALRQHLDDRPTQLCSSGQHREMLDQALQDFDLVADDDLAVMQTGQTLPSLTQRLLPRFDDYFERVDPAAVVVQGDTTTAFVGALSAFYRHIPVAHVEAGLRTDNIYSPFPEEMNRRLISQIATLHFAPTTAAAAKLTTEGKSEDSIVVTGNTAIDALFLVRPVAGSSLPWNELGRQRPRLIFATIHRRENHGEPILEICAALRHIVDAHDDVGVVLPVHPNPAVQQVVRSELGDVAGVLLTDPLPYSVAVAALRACEIVVTDSGGLQEEAPAFDKPVLVLRRETERGEGVEAGVSVLVGTRRADIVAEVSRLLTDREAYARMAASPNPFGDGRAALRMVAPLRRLVGDSGVDQGADVGV